MNLSISAFIEEVYKEGLSNRFDIADIVNSVRKICKDIDYSQTREALKSKIKSDISQYSHGTKLMGYLGYYYPSQLRTLRTDNMKRGRLTKTHIKSDYIYNYDSFGKLVSIICPDTHTTVYRIDYGFVDLYITYEDYPCRDNPDVLNTTFVKKDLSGYMVYMLDILWSCNMEIVFKIELDIGYDNNLKYRIVSAMESQNGEFQIYENCNYHVKYNDSMELISFTRNEHELV